MLNEKPVFWRILRIFYQDYKPEKSHRFTRFFCREKLVSQMLNIWNQSIWENIINLKILGS